MADLLPTVEVFFDLPAAGADVFTLDDDVKGKLDSATYTLAGDGLAVDISAHCWSVSTRRGRDYEFDEFQTGVAVVELRNFDGRFLPDELDTEGLAPYGTGAIVPGRRVRITAPGGVVIYDGQVEDWNYRYRPGGDAEAEMVCEDAFGRLARKDFDAWTTDASQLPGARIGSVLDRSEVAFGASRDLDDGVNTLQSDNVSHGSNVLNYLQLVARSDLGRLFAARDGVLTYRDRLSLAGQTPAVEFSDGSFVLENLTTEDGEPLTKEDGVNLTVPVAATVDPIAYHRIEVLYGSETLFNRVGVDREGGILQTANDIASQDAYDVRVPARPLSGLLMDSDTASADMADFLVGLYSQPAVRVSSLQVIVDTLSPAHRSAVTALEIGDVVSVTFAATGMEFGRTETLVVEGIAHSVDVDSTWVATLALSPLFQDGVFVLDSATFGVLDSDAPLAY